MRVVRVVRLLLLLLFAVPALSQKAPPPASKPLFDYEEVMIPVLDGVHLQTVIPTPTNATEPLPVLFRGTPYGVAPARSAPNVGYREYASDSARSNGMCRCATTTTSFSKVTASWSKCNPLGFRSSTAIRKNSCPAFTRRKRVIFARQRGESIPRPKCLRT